jgi:hypothetical protein
MFVRVFWRGPWTVLMSTGYVLPLERLEAQASISSLLHLGQGAEQGSILHWQLVLMVVQGSIWTPAEVLWIVV